MANEHIIENIQNAIFDSMEIYYKEMSKNNQYDITVNATIVDVSKKPEGIYRVRTDDAEFEAYANAGEYYKHDNVLIQIPNGNYKNQKFILGRSLDEKVANQTFNFRLPFDNFIPLRQLNRGDNAPQVKEGAYWANYPSYREEISSKYQSEEKLGTLVWEWYNTNSSTIGNTRLGIEADWQVLLGNYQPLRGTYGFIITIKGLSSATNAEAAQEIERVEYFTNRDMYGNTYAFASPYSQQKVIDISEFLNIHSIKINFYQDYMFADGDNTPISYFDRDSFGHPIVPENILFSNTNIFLGVSAEDIKDETVYLYSYDALGYQSEEEKIQDSNGDILPTGNWICNDEHDLRMVWVHYEKDGTYSVIDNLEELLKQEETSGKDTHIYWYRYNYDEIKNTAEQFFPGQEYEIVDGKYIPKIDELGYPIFSDVNNEIYQEYKLLYKDLMDEKENSDYQSRITRYGGTNWNFLAYLTDTFNTNIIPRGNFSREKFKVVIQHHGTKTQSKELILTNNHDVESQIAENARNDAIIIKTFKLVKEKYDDGKWINGQYEAKEDGSLNAFYVYDENNAILTNDDNERFDQHEYYVQIWIRNEETNDYELLRTIDEYGLPNGINIAWSFPTSYTMIRSSLEVTAEDAKYFKINALNDPIGFENFHNATMKFTINPILNNRYMDNNINVIIRRNGMEHHIKKDLQFGRAESLGHDFLPIIEIIYPVGGHYLCNAQNAEFQIGCTVYNKDGTPYKTPQTLTFIWKELSGGEAKFYNTGKNYDEEITDGYLIGEHHHRENGDPSLVGQMGSEMTTHYEEKYKKYKNNVVYGFLKSDSAPPIFEVTVIGAASYPLTVRKGFMMCNNASYQASRDFMIPSRVEFKSDGSEPLYYSNNFEVINSNSYEENNEIKIKQSVEYPDWNINNENILHLINSTVARSVIEKNGDLTERVDKSYKQYRLEFNTNGNPQWLDEYLDPQAYTYISYEDNGNKILQSIAFDRNLYSSSLVNEWDGTSLTWDEENGAILSTMIAAGSKDGNNRFTGVMMGDWKTKGNESLDIPGLYGYEKGEQSFGFKTNGSAFLGKSGKGRIIFDGNQSVIKSADENCYINLNPIHKNLNGTFDMNDISNQSFSENFLYCKVNKSQNSFSDVFNSIAGPDSWAREYFKDEDHDYFVVDPNYGVLTTGGVVARYGKLGNWMISEEGLYQKTNNSYVYLGRNTKDIIELTKQNNLFNNIKTKYIDLKDNYVMLDNKISELQIVKEQLSTSTNEIIININNIKAKIETIYNIKLKDINEILEFLLNDNKNYNNTNPSYNKYNTVLGWKQLIIDSDVAITNLENELNSYTLNYKDYSYILEQLFTLCKQYIINKNLNNINTIYEFTEEVFGFYNDIFILCNISEDQKKVFLNEIITLIKKTESPTFNKDNIDISNIQFPNDDFNILCEIIFYCLSIYDDKLSTLMQNFFKFTQKYYIISEDAKYDTFTEEQINYKDVKQIYDDALNETKATITKKYTDNIYHIEYNNENLNKLKKEVVDYYLNNFTQEILNNDFDGEENININQTNIDITIEKLDNILNNIQIILWVDVLYKTGTNKKIDSYIDKNTLLTNGELNIYFNQEKQNCIEEINILNNQIYKYEQELSSTNTMDSIVYYQQQLLEDEINKIYTSIDTNVIIYNELLSNINTIEDISNYLLPVGIDYIDLKEILNNITEDIFTNIYDLIKGVQVKTPTYAIYISDQQPVISNNQAEYNYSNRVEPFFSVDWHGNFYAKKGIIANTWIIDDHSLTYEKNFAKIYLGQEELNNGWAFSAGTTNMNNSNYNINFGISIDGKLYAKLGEIAGWQFNDKYFISKNQNLLLDSSGNIYAGKPRKLNENTIVYPLTIDGEKGILSIVGSNSEEIATGYIYLGNFNVEALSNNGWIAPNSIKIENDYKAGLQQYSLNLTKTYNNTNSWGGGSSLTVAGSVSTLSYYPQIVTQERVELSQSNTFNIVTRNNNNNNYGIAIATGITNTNKQAVALYPVNCDNSYATLGIEGALWNVYANIINCADLQTTGSLSSKMILMNQEKVATEPWVYNKLAEVWNAIKSAVSGGSANAVSLGKLGGSLRLKAITKVDKKFPGGGKINLLFKNEDNKIVYQIDGLPRYAHGHRLTFRNNKIEVSTVCEFDGDGGGVNLSHTHEVSGSIDLTNAKLTLTFTSTDFSDGGSSSISLTDLRDYYWKKGYNAAVDRVGILSDLDSVTFNYPTKIPDSAPYGTTPNSSVEYKASLSKKSSTTYSGDGPYNYTIVEYEPRITRNTH